MAWQLLIAVVLYVVGELIRKPNFPEDRESVPFEDAGIPSVDPKASKGVIWGKETIRAPHVMDAVEYFTIELTQKVKATLFKSKNVVIGHRYFMGLQLGLGEGPLTLSRIYYDDRLLWEGTAASNDDGIAITINEPDFLGGEEEGGGLVGTIRFFAGTATQNVSTYLDSFHPGVTPAYRRVSPFLRSSERGLPSAGRVAGDRRVRFRGIAVPEPARPRCWRTDRRRGLQPGHQRIRHRHRLGA